MSRKITILLRSLVKLVMLMFVVSFIVFALVSISPIDPVQANVGQVAYLNMSEIKRAQLAQYWGSTTPLLERYTNWLVCALHGDLGTSLRFNAPVTSVIANKVLNSLVLMSLAWLLSGMLGFFLGLVAGFRHGSLTEHIIKGYCYLTSSLPTFWIALVFLMVFAVYLGWFPSGFSAPIGVLEEDVTFLDVAYHLVLPVLALSVTGVSNIALHTREKVIATMEEDYFKFGLTRGLTPWQALMKHGLRNLILPGITIHFSQISEIFGGSVLVEQVFSYPGLGQAAVTAGLGSDAALLVGIALCSAAIVFIGNFIADVCYDLIDPRIGRGESHV